MSCNKCGVYRGVVWAKVRLALSVYGQGCGVSLVCLGEGAEHPGCSTCAGCAEGPK